MKQVEEKKQAADVVSTDILETFRTVRKGGMVFDLSQKMESLVKAVRDTKQKGSLRLKLTLTPEDGDSTAIKVEDEIRTVEPEDKKPATFFFATEKGALQRNDPRQDQFPESAGFDR